MRRQGMRGRDEETRGWGDQEMRREGDEGMG